MILLFLNVRQNFPSVVIRTYVKLKKNREGKKGTKKNSFDASSYGKKSQGKTTYGWKKTRHVIVEKISNSSSGRHLEQEVVSAVISMWWKPRRRTKYVENILSKRLRPFPLSPCSPRTSSNQSHRVNFPLSSNPPLKIHAFGGRPRRRKFRSEKFAIFFSTSGVEFAASLIIPRLVGGETNSTSGRRLLAKSRVLRSSAECSSN